MIHPPKKVSKCTNCPHGVIVQEVILNGSQTRRLIHMKRDHRHYDPSHGITNLCYNTNSDETLIANNFFYNISKRKGEKDK